ncbi:MAG: hydroxymethylbilane synthase [Thermoanaerobaculia bacterium]
MSARIRIGTRGSRLALWQAGDAAKKFNDAGFATEIVTITTTGDKHQDVPLATVGGKGVFIKELEEALERGEIEVAVHSLKDVPSIVPGQFALAAYLERADPRDAWIHPGRQVISDLRRGAVVGTSAPRRHAQLIDRYPHLTIKPIRGNVDSRLGKTRDGHFAGVVLASAGLTRLGRAGEITSWFSIEEMIPAAGQGIVVIETLASNRAARKAAASINDTAAEAAALCERGVLQRFGTRLDCYSAIAVHATSEADSVTIRAFVGSAGSSPARASIRVKNAGRTADDVITKVYDELVANGAMELLGV